MSTRSRSVLQGTFITSAACAFGTGLHGIITIQPNTALRALSAGINGGISGVTFFSVREFAVSPLLVSTLPSTQYERRRKGENDAEDLRWSEIRSDRLIDSGISGSITGGFIRGITRRNLRGVFPGAISAGVLCVLLQYMYNETRVMRLEYLAHQHQNSVSPASPSPYPSETLQASKSWTERLLGFIGVKSISDEEYLASLKKQRDTHLKRIAELEGEVKREKDGTA